MSKQPVSFGVQASCRSLRAWLQDNKFRSMAGNATREQATLALVAELEKAVGAMRSGDVDGIAYAEVQPTALYLLEGSQRIHSLLRERFRDLTHKEPLQKLLDELADSDYELACVISGFMEAVFDLINREPSFNEIVRRPDAGPR